MKKDKLPAVLLAIIFFFSGTYILQDTVVRPGAYAEEWILIGALRSPACRRERNWSLCHRRLGKVTAGDETRLFLKVGFGNPPRTNWWASKLLPSFTYQNLIRAAGRCPAAQAAAGPERRQGQAVPRSRLN